VVGLGERGNPAAEGVPDLLQARRGRHRVPAVLEELDHLPAHLQLRQVAMQVEPVKALQVQCNMAVQRIHHRHDIRARETCSHDNPPQPSLIRRMRLPAQKRHAGPGTSAVSGRACLDE
jgi:hypothetical protein